MQLHRNHYVRIAMVALALALSLWSAAASAALPQRVFTTVQEGLPDMFASAYGAGTYVAGGLNGALYTSSNGAVWTKRLNQDPDCRFIFGITYGGGQFVAVGSPNIALTSPNGVTWTSRFANSGFYQLNAVVYGAGRYVAVGGLGTVVTSANAIQWTARSSGTFEWLQGIAFGANTFVAVGGRALLTSPDGVSWTQRPTPSRDFVYLNSVAYDGTEFIAVGDEMILTSPDGITWTDRILPDRYEYFTDVVTGNGATVVVGYGIIRRSFDRATWDEVLGYAPLPSNGVGRSHFTAAYGPAGFVALGSGGSVFRSADGSSWTSATDAFSRKWNDIAHGNGKFCAVGWEGAIASSSDGATFTQHAAPSSDYFYGNAIAWADGPGRFVAVGNSAIFASPDCQSFDVVNHWTQINGWFSDVVYGGEDDLLVAVGDAYGLPLVATSPDGIQWTKADVPIGAAGYAYLDRVAYGAGRFVATGYHYTSDTTLWYTSEDGIVWSIAPSPLNEYEYPHALEYSNGLFVALSSAIWTSPDGIEWTEQDAPGWRIADFAFGDGRFVGVGWNGATLVSADGENWEEHDNSTKRNLRAIAFSEALHRFVAVGESTILRTDDSSIVSFEPVSYSVTEGTLTRSLTVRRSGSLGRAVSVEYATSEGTAAAGQDYVARSARLTLPAGKETGTITIPILNDTLDEDLDETFRVTLKNPSSGAFLGDADSAEVIISDNDEAGVIEMGLEKLRVVEGKGLVTLRVPVIRTGQTPLAGGVEVTLATFAGTAQPGEDYTEATSTVTFGAGVRRVLASIKIPADAIDENDETFDVRLTGVSGGATLGARTSSTATIVDDDTAGSIQFSAATYSGTEGVRSGRVLVKLVRTGGLALASVELSIESGSATPGQDFELLVGRIDFAAGQKIATVPLTIVNDDLAEGPEGLTLRLVNPGGGATLGVRTGAAVTIRDNEPVTP